MEEDEGHMSKINVFINVFFSFHFDSELSVAFFCNGFILAKLHLMGC